MIRGFKATRNAKRYRGRYGSHLQGSQSTNEGKVNVFSGKIPRKKLRFMSLEAKRQEANNNLLSFRIKRSKRCMRNLFYRLKCIR